MPVVPTYDGPHVLPAQSQAPQAQDPYSSGVLRVAKMVGAEQGEQATALGNAMQEAGNGIGAVAQDAQLEANAVNLGRAQNAYLTTLNTLTTNDQQTGFRDQMGMAALPHDGKGLVDVYGASAEKAASDIASSILVNEAQRKAFAPWSQNELTAFRTRVSDHAYQQYHSVKVSTFDTMMKVGQDTILANPDDPDAVKTQMDNIRGAALAKANALGMAPVYAEQDGRDGISAALTQAVQAKIKQGDITGAQAYFDHYNSVGGFNGDDTMRIHGMLSSENDLRQSQAAVAAASNSLDWRFNPSTLGKWAHITSITGESESGNRDFNPDGTPIVSSAGARFAMQVTPATAHNPGFGVRPAKDDSPEEYDRVGRELLPALAQHYAGDPAKMWAAYNDGPGNLDKALALARQNGTPWLSHLPKETQIYVGHNMAKLNAVGTIQRPTEADYIAAAKQNLRPDASPKVVQDAVEQAQQAYRVAASSADQRDRDAFRTAAQALQANGGDFHALTPDVIAAVPGEMVPQLQSIGKSIAEGREGFGAVTDPKTYNGLKQMAANDPASFSRLDLMPDMHMLSKEDWQSMVNLQAGTSRADAKTMETQRVASLAISSAKANLAAAGIDLTPKPGSQQAIDLEQFENNLYRSLDAETTKLQRPLTADEARSVVMQELVQGKIGMFGTKRLFQVEGTPDLAKFYVPYDQIPAADESKIFQHLVATGNKHPSQKDVEEYYSGWLRAAYGRAN